MEGEVNVAWLIKVVGVAVVVVIAAVKIGVALWWRPRRIEEHFYKQGIRGPPYRFFIGNVKELVGMMMKASAQPMPTTSHNILPRVLSFYHHWKKIYGPFLLLLSHTHNTVRFHSKVYVTVSYTTSSMHPESSFLLFINSFIVFENWV